MIQTARLDYAAAVDAARSALPGGEIADLDLEYDDGRVTWEASVYDRGGPELSVIIDAASGEVLFTGYDDQAPTRRRAESVSPARWARPLT